MSVNTMDNNFGFCFGSVLRSLMVGASTIFSPIRMAKYHVSY